MPRLSRLLERIAHTVEEAQPLDRLADPLQSVVRALPAGRIKDALSGTPIGHPMHPLLVTVPIGAWTSAAVLDLTGGDRAAARRLIGLGLVSAVPTALTGASDWGDTSGAERRVGILHASLNWVALALLGASWLSRRGDGEGGRATALAGLGLVGASGWLGGHLSYALGVGVDTTAFSTPPAEWADACADDDLQDGVPFGADVEGMPVLLVRSGPAVHALADRCTHRGAPLHEGTVTGGCIECPWHASLFRLDSGEVERGPATRPQAPLETRVVAGRVQVRRAESHALRTNSVQQIGD